MRRMLCRAAVSCILMSANATEAMLKPGLMVLGYDGQVDLAARGKVLIQWRSGEASGECAGRTTRGCGQEPGWASKAWEGNTGVTVDESIREEDGSDDEEKDESNEDIICQLSN